MTATHTERAIANWLSDLGKLTAGHAPIADAKAKIATLAAALAAEFDANTFNRNSLLHVARRCKFFPTFGEACEALAEWRQQNLAHRAIQPPADGMTDDDRVWIAAWERYAGGDWGTDREGGRRTGTEQNLRWRLQRLQAHSSSAFEHLIANNPRALRIAKQDGLISPDHSVLRAAATPIRSDVRRGEPLQPDA